MTDDIVFSAEVGFRPKGRMDKNRLEIKPKKDMCKIIESNQNETSLELIS